MGRVRCYPVLATNMLQTIQELLMRVYLFSGLQDIKHVKSMIKCDSVRNY